MQLISAARQARISRVLRFVLAVSFAILLGASCGSDDSGIDQVTSTATGANGDSSAEQLETNDDQAEPVATTAPISSTTETGDSDDDGSGAIAPTPTAAASSTEATEATDDAAGESASDDASTGIELGALSRTFGGNDTVCRSVLIAPLAPPEEGQAASACLLAEIDAARPVVLDFGLITNEGDPIYYRYAFDGTQTLVVNDSRLDAFGSQIVVAQLCQTIEPGPLVPVPSGCSPTTSTGIAEADQ